MNSKPDKIEDAAKLREELYSGRYRNKKTVSKPSIYANDKFASIRIRRTVRDMMKRIKGETETYGELIERLLRLAETQK